MKGNNNKPEIILVRPQLPQNIGMCARAMKNFCSFNLSLVNPREGEKVVKMEETLRASSGACDIIENAKIFSSLEASLQNCNVVYSLSNRAREINKQTISLKDACKNIAKDIEQGKKSAFLFGPEASGLSNKDIEESNYLISIETNKEFASLNLSQSVMLVCYELFKTLKTAEPNENKTKTTDYASQLHYSHLFRALESNLANNKNKDVALAKLKNIFLRSNLTVQEINLLHLLLK